VDEDELSTEAGTLAGIVEIGLNALDSIGHDVNSLQLSPRPARLARQVAEGGEIAVTRRSLRSIMLDIDHKSTAPPARGFNQMARLVMKPPCA
jgi:hypothetical protein